MRPFRTWQYRVSRAAGKGITRLVAALTLYRMPPFVATSAIVADGDRVLVVVDPIRDEPILPGGHLRWHESPESALAREVREETGYEIRVRALAGVFSGVERTGDPGVIRVVYEAELVGGELRSSPEGEARWTGIAELSESATRDAPVVRHWLKCRQHAAGRFIRQVRTLTPNLSPVPRERGIPADDDSPSPKAGEGGEGTHPAN